MGDLRVQYVTNEAGEKTAALVPIEDWQKIFSFYREHAFLKASIERGFADVQAIKEGKQKAQSLMSFLDEL